MSTVIDQQLILDALRMIPENRWGEVLRFLETMVDPEPAILTGADLAQSGMVGSWADRDDLGTGQEFARKLRREAEARRGTGDAPGY